MQQQQREQPSIPGRPRPFSAIFGVRRAALLAQALLVALFTLTIVLVPAGRVHAQGDVDPNELGDAAGPVRDLRKIHDKTVIFVFDVSGSMRGDNLRRAREATVNILREGTSAGDRVVLMTFGSGWKTVFDEKLTNEAAKDTLIQKVPSRPEDGEGTNIRRPHYEALKILDAALPKPGAVILLTDSFNDEPKPTDETYPDYLKFYTPGGRLLKYPNTPENRDYERLLRKLARSRKVNAFGIGIQIDESTGRPVERLPQAEATPAPATPAPSHEPAEEEKPTSPLLFILLGALALLGVLAALFLGPRTRAHALRISGGPGGPKDYLLKSGQSLRIGGKGASFAADAYGLPGPEEPVAEIRVSGGQLRIGPPRQAAAKPVAAGAAVSNPNSASRVFHNGLPLEKEEALGYGDELRVSVMDPSGAGVNREYRLKFDDPRKSF